MRGISAVHPVTRYMGWLVQLSGPCEPYSGGRLVLGPSADIPEAAPSVQAIAYLQSLPAYRVSLRVGLVPQVGPVARRWIAAAGPGSFAPSAVMGLLNHVLGGGCKSSASISGVSVVTFARGGGAAPPGTKVRGARGRRRNPQEAL